MIFPFTYDYAILGVIVAPDIEGAAEIDFRRNGSWRITAICLDRFDSKDSVILPDDHPLYYEIKQWLLKHKSDAINEAVGAEIPRNDPNDEHRLRKWEVV